MSTCGIYLITENETGLVYVGQSKNIERRWKEHKKTRPVDLYTYEILLKCEVQYLNFFEKAFILGYDSHRNGLNKTIGGTNIRSTHFSEETIAKLSAAGKGNQNALGCKHSEEAIVKRAAANKGKKRSEEAKEKMSAAKKGIPQSEEHKANRAAAYKAYWERKNGKKFIAKIQ